MKHVKRLSALLLALLLCLSTFSVAGAATFRRGTKGDGVKVIQQALVDQGIADLTVDGKYGAKTTAAVAHFQMLHGLKIDGIAGSATLKALLGSDALLNEEHKNNVITQGDKGTDVRGIQSRLRELGYSVTVDGKYGKSTTNAVKSFQKLNSLKVDGIAGKKTIAKLYSDSAVAYSKEKAAEKEKGKTTTTTTYQKLRRGSMGPSVAALQQALKNRGYAFSVTSIYDADTENAVKAFQSDYGLTVDGIAGKITQGKLYSLK